ncbi:hypothetical protein GP486_002010 [Trichoglossum hirsutum]|uniref:HNH nuclease domain-containing protein n=1 Tax=Trichoglossum hirsutum TaxID=265104 RepID=A0A9P8LFR5_9PEZI|nr:hypothetical protein GP486_002010 [Trichoglossum hirsutum]
MSRATVYRNVHFLDRKNNEIAGFWQNGSVVWNQIAEWMHIVIDLPSLQFAIFQCQENGDPQDPVGNHGPSINLVGNNCTITEGYYIILSVNGEPLDITVTQETAVPRSVSFNLSNPDPRWRSGQWSQKIEDDFPDIGESKIHSLQNGILLSESAHTYFDKYRIAINPDARGPEYDWDEDITPGMDSVSEISHSENGKLRLELIMAERLNSLIA